jgi:DNA-binding MarR family transcriptional regulator
MAKDIEKKTNEHLLRLMDNLQLFDDSTPGMKGLTIPETHTIALVGKMDSPRMSEIALQGRVTRGAVTLMINKLEQKGYVKKIRSDNDRRVVRVELTAKGRTVERNHRRYHERKTVKMMSGLTPAEKREIERLLRKIVATLG